MKNWLEEIIGGGKQYADGTHDFVLRWNTAWEEGRMQREHLEKLMKARDRVEAIKVSIEPSKLDMEDFGGENLPAMKKYEFRPQTWDQFIGQSEAKAMAPIIVQMFKDTDKSHLLLTGLQGHGKTTYIKLLAKSMGAKLIETIGHAVNTKEAIIDILKQINKSEQPCVFFVDEIDTMPTEMIKYMNPIVESFECEGRRVKPFIFACATINLDTIAENNPDFLDRIDTKINFVHYTIDELKTIALQVKIQLYPTATITDEQYTLLAENCKLNPRRVIVLLKYLVVDGDIKHVLEINQIVKNGLTKTDVSILKFLASQKKPVGANVIAMKHSMRQRQYETQYEGYLFQQGLLNRTPQRVITAAGRKFLTAIRREGGAKK
jgi:Holliday junction resolvasome RuvABC ATP-dependent DNA helicase subunit